MLKKINFNSIMWTTPLAALLTGCSPEPVKLNLDGTWQLQYDPQASGIADGWATWETDQWESTEVPGFFGDGDYDGIAWYAKDVSVPESVGSRQIAMVFEAVDDNAIVFINGIEVGRHYGWDVRFWVKIPPGIDAGERFHLAVRIEDTGGPGGIIKSVWLQTYDREEELLVNEYGAMTAQKSPAWVSEAVLYEIFVRDFSPTGDFAGVEARLDDLADLGVNVLWLMPIHPIGEAMRKGPLGSPYSTADYYGINPDFGTADQFQSLVDAVHRHDMRLILDMVPNHTAWDNAMLTDHPDWYTQNEAGEIIMPPGTDWTDVADLNYENPDLSAYMREMLVWWVAEHDVDGFRIDVAELTPAEFWIDTRAELEKAKRDVFLLAEGNRPYLHVSGFDATYASGIFSHLIDIAEGKLKAIAIHDDLIAEKHSYPQGSIRMRFVENHDQIRAAAATPSEPALRAITAVAYLLPGFPLIYNGSEAALKHRLELFDVDPIDWSAGSDDFRKFVKRLLQLRSNHSMLTKSGYQAAPTTNENILAFLRDEILVMANLSATAQFATFKTAPVGLSTAERLFTSGEASINAAQDAVELEAWGVGVFTLDR